jgi:oxygen-independent coproporphyrinogen-3 oxidase
VHLYIHVPFCARRCSYCDFAIAVRKVTPTAAFVAAMRAEWQRWQQELGGRAAQIETLYFGGGTPSRLEGDAIAELIAMVQRAAPLAAGAEVTLETNPDDVTPDRAAAWVTAGVNRISLGVQSHDPAVLTWMHRSHRAEQVPPAVQMLKAAGLGNVSMDLIFALPEVLERDWARDLELTLALDPAHLSLYGLTVEPHTPLARWTARGEALPARDERYAAEFLAADAAMTSAGFVHYEVSNAGRPGFESRHNRAYWSGAEYVGLGPSAHSFIAGERRWNAREWADYVARLDRGESVVAGREQIGTDAGRLERIYLGLRTSTGVPVALVPGEALAAWVRAGWAVTNGATVRLLPEGWLRLDALVGAIAHS